MDRADPDLDIPLIAVTADAHIGPRLKEDLRDYCPKQYLEEYDEFVRAYEPQSDPSEVMALFAPKPRDRDVWQSMVQRLRNNATPGHHDVNERLTDMNRDGVAVEVIFHGSQNGQCFPFIQSAGGTFNALFFSPTGDRRELELVAAGQHMYNQWLADQCSVEPERHVGLAHLPMWDVEAAIEELEWASSAGLRGTNFPAPKPGIKPYDHPEWEPFWAECEERGMTLNIHDGASAGVGDLGVHGRHSNLLQMMDELPRKLLPRMIFGGVFERHPGLRLIFTELQPRLSKFWRQLAHRYDEVWEAHRDTLGDQVPRPPSDYMRSNVFLGQSRLIFFPEEVALAVEGGYSSNMLWGSDYPHIEGSYRHSNDDEEETWTVLGLRHAFAGVPAAIARGMVGENAVDVYGLDRAQLSHVATRIGAVTLRRLATPLDTVPEEWGRMAASLRV